MDGLKAPERDMGVKVREKSLVKLLDSSESEHRDVIGERTSCASVGGDGW